MTNVTYATHKHYKEAYVVFNEYYYEHRPIDAGMQNYRDWLIAHIDEHPFAVEQYFDGTLKTKRDDGNPEEKFLIAIYESETLDSREDYYKFFDLIQHAWYGAKIVSNPQTLTLDIGGWNGNREIIDAIKRSKLSHMLSIRQERGNPDVYRIAYKNDEIYPSDIIAIIEERIKYHTTRIKEYEQKLSPMPACRNELEYKELLEACNEMRIAHNQILELFTLEAFIEAREEEIINGRFGKFS